MTSKTKVFLAYDERMTLHRPRIMTEDTESSDFNYERPSRLLAVYNALMDLEDRLVAEQSKDDIHLHTLITGQEQVHSTSEAELCEECAHRRYLTDQRYVPLEVLPASREIICRVHSEEHYEFMKRTATLSEKELDKLTEESEDLYFCRDTFGAALLAVGGCVAAVEAVTAPFRVSRRAMALVRPPAHHATRDSAMGKSVLNYDRHCYNIKNAKPTYSRLYTSILTVLSPIPNFRLLLL